jgi:peptide/nickel transport system permease protein
VLVLTLVMLALGVMPGSDPHAITSEVMPPPSAAHVLGIDELGCDVLLGILQGIRVSLIVGFAAALGATLIGVAVGAVAGFYGSILDLLCMRLSAFQVVASFILAAVIVAFPVPACPRSWQ